MRPPGPFVVIPITVVLWVFLIAGHLCSTLAPVPALLERPARDLSLCLAVCSLALGALSARRPTAARRWRASRTEAALGWISLTLAGLALGAEADRASWPLPVHPPQIAVALEGKVLDTTAIDAVPPAVLFEAHRARVGLTEAPCSARLVLRWREESLPPRWILPGLWLRVAGSYRPPEDGRNPGSSAPGRWLERLGIAGTITVDPLSISAPADPPERGGDLGGVLRDRMARTLSANLCAPVAGLARGMLLGDRSGISPAVRESFRDGGTIHILSISGLHVCILAGIISLITSALRLPLPAAIGLELATLWAYVALVGAPASALRSAILWTALRSGRAFGQVVSPFTAWGLAGLVLHIFEPASVLDPGFQLSFSAVLGLGASGVLSRIPVRVPSERCHLWGRLVRFGCAVWSLGLQSAGAAVGTAGIQARLFGAIPIIGLLLNLVVIPVCSIFMAEAVFLMVLVSIGAGALASAASGAVDASGLLLLGVNAWGATLLQPWMIPRIPAIVAVVAGAGALLAAWGRTESASGGISTRGSAARWSISALVLAALVPIISPGFIPIGSREHLVVLSLDVGQGDATWIGLRDGSAILIDAGPKDGQRDAGERAIEPALRAEGSSRMRAALLSHAHLDHFGGFAWMSRRKWIGTLLENGSNSSATWRSGLRDALRHGGGRLLTVGRDSTISFDSGDTLEIRRGLETGGENDRSLAATLHAPGATALFPGDLEAAGEAALLPHLGPIDILKAPHHGSRTSSGDSWVARLRPRIVLISCGEQNQFGHPDREVIYRYRHAGAFVYRTDEEGAIRLTLTPSGVWVSTRRHPAPEWVPWRHPKLVTPSSYSP